MIRYDKNLLVSKSLRMRKLHIMRKLAAGKFVHSVFLITEPMNKANTYDIIESKFLLFHYYKERDIRVYALAKSNEEAKELLLKLVERKEWQY